MIRTQHKTQSTQTNSHSFSMTIKINRQDKLKKINDVFKKEINIVDLNKAPLTKKPTRISF